MPRIRDAIERDGEFFLINNNTYCYCIVEIMVITYCTRRNLLCSVSALIYAQTHKYSIKFEIEFKSSTSFVKFQFPEILEMLISNKR